jgi:hypothetical protein
MVLVVREAGVAAMAAVVGRAEEEGMAEDSPGEADGTAGAVEDGREAMLAGAAAVAGARLVGAEVMVERAEAEAADANKLSRSWSLAYIVRCFSAMELFVFLPKECA